MSFWCLQFSQKTNKNNSSWVTVVKVRQNRNDFFKPTFLPKNKPTNSSLHCGTSNRIVFVRFLGELKSPKRHFEINWPLEKIKLFQKLIDQRLKLHLWLHAQPEIQILKVIYSILSTNFIFAPSSIPFKGNLQQNRQTKAGELDLQWFRIMMHVTYFST